MNEPAIAPPAKSGVSYVNLLATGLAIFVSLLSLWLAWSSNNTQERMLAASSWPYLRYGHGNFDPERQKHSINLELSNGGSGPALVHWVRVKYKQTPVNNSRSLFNACCATSKNPELDVISFTSTTNNTVIAPDDSTTLLRLDKADDTTVVWEELDKQRYNFTVEACYCSLIGECWKMNTATLRQPVKIDQCSAPPIDAWDG